MINQSSNPQFEWNQNDTCLLYVMYFSLLCWGALGWLCYECIFFFLSHSEISHLCSQDDLMTDPIAGGKRGWQNVFISLTLSIAQESACALPNIWSHVSAWAGLKGIRACGLKCVRVSGGTLLHFQASAPPSTKQYSDIHILVHTLTQSCTPQWPLSLLVSFLGKKYFSSKGLHVINVII